MEINNMLLENIITLGKSEELPIFDDIQAQEDKMSENKDLYDVFYNIKKVLDSPSRYGEIQSIAPSIDVNNGLIKIDRYHYELENFRCMNYLAVHKGINFNL